MPSKYEPLRRHLMGVAGERTRLSFGEIEQVLGFRLPSSARRYAPWWANTGGSHIQADAWMSAGWRTAQVDVPGEKVTFERVMPGAAPDVGHAAAGVEDAGAPFERDDVIVIQRAALRGGAMRMLEDYCEAQGGDLAQAVVSLLNGMALERRRQLLERFPMQGAPSDVDSTALIREDRDAR